MGRMGFKLRIIAADSVGVRSMCNVVECSGVRIIIDPGAALAPRRYGLKPHPKELEALSLFRERIFQETIRSDVVIITHYHLDHYLYSDEYLEAYKDKLVLLKSYRNMINSRQKRRAYSLIKILSKAKAEVVECDGETIEFNDELTIKFSPPVWHGDEGTKLGWLLMVSIRCGDYVYTFCSDTQGPIYAEALNWVLSTKPNCIYLSGPPIYLAGYKIDEEVIKKAMNNLKTLLKADYVEKAIIDHHFARHKNYWLDINNLANKLKKNIVDAADYMGVDRRPLECMRKELWGKS